MDSGLKGTPNKYFSPIDRSFRVPSNVRCGDVVMAVTIYFFASEPVLQ
jgi:hypothetical protein